MQPDKDNIAQYKIIVIFWFEIDYDFNFKIMLAAFPEFVTSWNSCYKSDANMIM